MRYYEFLYYNLIKIWKKKKDEIENAPINGIITITFLPFVNLISIPLIVMAIFGTSTFDLPTFNKWLVLIPLGLLGLINYLILLRNGKSREIVARFDKLDSRTLKKGMIISITYLVITIAIPLIIFFFIPPRP